jgi:hypothetical protein
VTEAPLADSLFVADGPALVPTPLTIGPWSRDAQHGGPVAALLTRAVELEPAPGPFQVLRVTVELLRPAPIAPLEVSTHVSRAGRNVQLVEVSLTAAGIEIARARALRLRVQRVPVPAAAPEVPSPPGPDTLEPAPTAGMPTTGFLGAVDLRFVRGSWLEMGPAVLWGRLTVPLVAGERTSELQQLAAIADFGNGVSRVVDFGTHTFINPDLTIALSRPPTGTWIGMDSVTRLADLGYGQSESLLFDAGGPVGRSVQTLLVAER